MKALEFKREVINGVKVIRIGDLGSVLYSGEFLPVAGVSLGVKQIKEVLSVIENFDLFYANMASDNDNSETAYEFGIRTGLIKVASGKIVYSTFGIAVNGVCVDINKRILNVFEALGFVELGKDFLLIVFMVVLIVCLG